MKLQLPLFSDYIKNMRLWHKDLIQYLPKPQLLAQWRELCAIASTIANKGSPNHLLVNKILNYSKKEFYLYTQLVLQELKARNFQISTRALENFNRNYYNIINKTPYNFTLFENWHNDRYLKQCLYNLQEKFDCGGIAQKDWLIIEKQFNSYFNS